MDVVGSEIGQKMRSAIKAKLTELGCYVDDELPDYVMVMVANKRTRAQMEDDLQLFLGENTELFVNWLHQVLKKLQEVTITAPLKADLEKRKERSSSKEKKDKSKKGESSKKSKKKEKSRKKEEKKSIKAKKKSKHEMIRPNIPPLLMNMEKDSEPSITDVFAGQILKNHGVLLESFKEDSKKEEIKPVVKEKRPIIPIIDPETISSQPELSPNSEITESSNKESVECVTPTLNSREESIKEMNKIEAKIQGLKQKLTDQLDSMSDDEDFLNIRTEAEELMNDFAEDVFQEISQPPPETPPLRTKTLTPVEKSPQVVVEPKVTPKEPELPQIELNLPKRPIRERLGVRNELKETAKKPKSPERFTPEKQIEPRHTKDSSKSSKSRTEKHGEPQTKNETKSDKHESSRSHRLTSKVSVLENRKSSCASVVRVRPRPRVSAPASSLLLRAVADAHKSLLNIPPKVDHEPQKIQRALVLPMRRCEPQKIVIQVPGETSQSRDITTEKSNEDRHTKSKKEEFVPQPITKVFKNDEYVPLRSVKRQDEPLDTINIHNTTVDKDKGTQFVVTLDGYHPNAFLAKKLMTEGILDEEIEDKPKETKPSERETNKTKVTEKPDIKKETENAVKDSKVTTNSERRLSTSERSDTQVVVKQEEKQVEKRKTEEKDKLETPPIKKRKASPIVFDVGKKEKEKEKEEVERVRERTVSASSDSVTLTTCAHKYDDLPPLSLAEKKTVWCRTFPNCRFGPTCVFQHPRCKFLAACTRRGCMYEHSLAAPLGPPPVASTSAPLLASHVVPAANYKMISSAASPTMCKFYPNCVNPACHYYHPKPCRFGKACANKLECNFYHNEFPAKWKYPV